MAKPAIKSNKSFNLLSQTKTCKQIIVPLFYREGRKNFPPTTFNFKRLLFSLITPLVFICANLAAEEKIQWHGDEQSIMGTRISVQIWMSDEKKAEQAIAAVMNEMRRIDKEYSPWIETSQLYKLNQSVAKATQKNPVKISPELSFIMDKSFYYSKISEGAFDITFASLARYYDYRKKLKPSEAQREALLSAINYQHVHLDPKTHFVWFEHDKVYMDLGGIAKGYACDRAIEILKELGVTSASVTAGGDTRLLGNKSGKPWMVGIKNPRAEESVAITLPLEDTAVSTSGDYERYFIDSNGERVHHIINPKTGKSTKGIMSATILAPNGIDTDALSTTVFVMGAEKGLALINQLPGFDAIIITEQGKVLYSNGLMAPQ
jgi:FAD:protein FMN transferase